ncbi:type II toxin-antitoxin system Phd/YefM family antitoxin [Skermanella rosea]|uniref:type II toxin-antitoxin system Phd/YefM family antitoxin n=1 Tax=Skermanella rosea TaxID=1817965 RepID=UPI001932FA78|nr:type II toxin-antitoxin system Phd/YefM family antitoxin [Skermanella rosea]UEM05051.1 type II toxin-antitoxin system Phd/YefM family antitoxin [Skermanella rosea]
MKTITAAEANRQFSHLLHEVRKGTSYIVTSHGTPVATLAPADDELRARMRAHDALLSRLRDQPVTDIGTWDRDELYDYDSDPETTPLGGTRA